MNFGKMADVWNALMTGTLGYARYADSGTDYGALVTAQLGHKYAANLYGIHLGHDLPLDMFNSEVFFSHVSPIPPEVPDQLRAEILAFYDTHASHVMVHMLDAQTIIIICTRRMDSPRSIAETFRSNFSSTTLNYRDDSYQSLSWSPGWAE